MKAGPAAKRSGLCCSAREKRGSPRSHLGEGVFSDLRPFPIYRQTGGRIKRGVRENKGGIHDF